MLTNMVIPISSLVGRTASGCLNIFLLTFIALSLDTHATWLPTCPGSVGLKSLLLELSIQQPGSVASILSQSVKISNGLESILFIPRLAFYAEGQPAGSRQKGTELNVQEPHIPKEKCVRLGSHICCLQPLSPRPPTLVTVCPF